MKAIVTANTKGMNYFTVGRVYNVSPAYPEDGEDNLLFDVVDDEGDLVSIIISDSIRCNHGFKWEILR